MSWSLHTMRVLSSRHFSRCRVVIPRAWTRAVVRAGQRDRLTLTRVGDCRKRGGGEVVSCGSTRRLENWGLRANRSVLFQHSKKVKHRYLSDAMLTKSAVRLSSEGVTLVSCSTFVRGFPLVHAMSRSFSKVCSVSHDFFANDTLLTSSHDCGSSKTCANEVT